MNKKIFGFITAVVLAGIIANVNIANKIGSLSDFSLANLEALADEINPDCPNGCLAECSDGCWCRQWYPIYKEAEWN
jgi:hypothetical protein